MLIFDLIKKFCQIEQSIEKVGDVDSSVGTEEKAASSVNPHA